MKFISLFWLFVLVTLTSYAQELQQQDLDSVVITSSRIDLPFKENSRSITVISSKDIKESPATSVSDLLQQVAGVDIRRRGSNGMQGDLYIRGGGFDQTLLLIDGMKMDDAQTGHHTLNMALPLDVIERIEIIKGPAARVFGQNAFTGAINIVTKSNIEKVSSVGYQLGSNNQQLINGTFGFNIEGSSHIVHASSNTSDGYRYNTDYENRNYFLKSTFNQNKKMPISVTASYQERDFGANGFYASPSAKDQYEETKTSLLGVSSNYRNGNLTLKPRLYWKWNQDMYVFIRHNPAVYRNLHQTNKIGAELHGSYKSNLGTTGFGVDLAKVYISSNNLGQRDRFMTNVFLEHQFKLLDDNLDITPGVAITYFSDFKFHAFPGIDLGYQINDKLRVYGNIGYTYRIPTYTDLYYSDPTTLGNENLDPEEAIAEEIGLKFNSGKLQATATVFNRDSRKLIDFVKENDTDLWQATNVRDVNTKGVELQTDYTFNLAQLPQNISLGYTFIDDDVKAVANNFSRYSINSLKHQVVGTLKTSFIKHLSHNIVYKYLERTTGQSYIVLDANITATINQKLNLSLIANNIFNQDYYETNLVPMPKGNVIFGINYRF
ncbi:TonB-dependent receptor plug domain-containing protein [Mangrovimonas cancribranchiae]|uniref:TonB-dependent receptor n=1 Tax=Mangrovimonas cancribranchiae TaxID=3080055 RepID=A0AAU6P711_9FLAO